MLVDLFAQPLLLIAREGLGLHELLEIVEGVGGHGEILKDLLLQIDSGFKFSSSSENLVAEPKLSIQARRASECTHRQLPEDALACAASLYFNCFFLDPLGLSVSKVDGVFP